MTPETRAEAAAWIAKARMDLRAARADLHAVPPITGDSLFHCQQAVEKALKGFLAAHEGRLQKTHDLETLSLQCAEIAPHLESTLRGAYFLTTFASEFRYPGDVTEPGVEEANTGLAIASEVVEVIVSCLDRIP
ncbi:MAG: HEPN domain-containing protein [Spirochaetes bacterium]|nr:HEPN domain-containing protein [Spirochaetota bacterium]